MSNDPIFIRDSMNEIKELFSSDCAVSVEECVSTPYGLTKAEATYVCKAVSKRQNEFAAGRRAARRALAAIGWTGAEIRVRSDRSPLWPAGTIGSITHAGNLAVVVVGPAIKIEALGIDIEAEAALSPDLWDLVLTTRERQWVELQTPRERVRWATTIFSAKEAFYKFQYPITQQWLDFLDVEVDAISGSRFSVHVFDPAHAWLAQMFRGSALYLKGFILTAFYRNVKLSEQPMPVVPQRP